MCRLYIMLVAVTGSMYPLARAKDTDPFPPLPPLPHLHPAASDNATQGHDYQAVLLKEGAALCRGGAAQCGPGGAEGSPEHQEFVTSLKDMSEGIRTLLHSKDLTRLWAIIPRTILHDFPQVGLLGNVLGLQTHSWTNSIAAFAFFGWPLLLFALYIALIFRYPNRKSDSDFEKMMSSMVESWSHMMYAAEDNFLNFMEDMTEPDHSGFHSRIEDDAYDHQALHGDHYDQHDDHVDHENVDQHHSFLDASTGPFVPHAYRLEDKEGEGGDINRMTNVFGFPNEIPDDEKVHYLNIVLGGTYQHSTDDSLAQDGVVTGLVSPHGPLHPKPPTRYHPHPHPHPSASWDQPPDGQRPFHPTRIPGVMRFTHEPQPAQDGHPHPRFSPSALMEESLKED